MRKLALGSPTGPADIAWIYRALQQAQEASYISDAKTFDILETRDAIATVEIPTERTAILVRRHSTGTVLAPSWYVRGTSAGALAIADARGTYWEISLDQPLDLGAFGAATDTDCTAAAQAWAAALSTAAGGIGTVPFLRMGLASEVEIVARGTVSLLGNMAFTSSDPTAGAFFYPTQAIAGSLLKLSYSGSAARYAEVRGLAFLDRSALANANLELRRGYAITAAIEAPLFNLARMRGCQFEWLRGSAVKISGVQCGISESFVRFCGDTGKPALNIGDDAVVFSAQAFDISNNRIEVNFNAPYVRLAVGAAEVKLWGNGFEAQTDGALGAAASSQRFLEDHGALNITQLNHFGRNDAAESVYLNGNRHLCKGNTFQFASGIAVKGTAAASFAIVEGNQFFAGGTGNSIDVAGFGSQVANNAISFAGGIRCAAFDGRVEGNEIWQCTKAAGGAIAMEQGLRVANNTVHSSALSTLSGILDTVGGLVIANNAISIQATGINANTAGGTIVGNVITGCTTAKVVGTNVDSANVP